MASSELKLIVGLGNPGAEYARTRHNAGFWLVDELARRHGGNFRNESRHQGEIARVKIGGRELWLLKPTTFMNRSGGAVQSLSGFYKIAPGEILVAHDEIDLPVAALRLKEGGGHGGHNGLRDIHAQLGSADYWRLRLGIGHPGVKAEVADYVLRKPPSDQREAIEKAIIDSLQALDLLIDGPMDKALMKLHAKPPRPKPPRPAPPANPPASPAASGDAPTQTTPPTSPET